MKYLTRSALTTVLLSMFATAAAAQAEAEPEAVDVVVMELDQLVEEGAMEGEILDVNYDERSLTVRWDANNETAKLIVPENADLIQQVPNRLQSPLDLTDFRPGDQIKVEGLVVEGAARMRISSGSS